MKGPRRSLCERELDKAYSEEEMREQRAQCERDAANDTGPQVKARDESEASATASAPAGLTPLDKPCNDIDKLFEEGPPVPLPRLAEPPALPPSACDTETLLNGLIEECRFLLREVAFNSARLTPNVDDRVRFLSSAESLALTGAKIADTVVRLRASGSEHAEEHRHRLIYEHVKTASPPPPGENSP